MIDGGNSNFRDSMLRGQRLAAQQIGFIDCGTSGGVWGLDNGYCLMVGGTAEDVARARPIFDTLAPEGGGFAHAGPIGAGHFTKMVHNGVEYGMMQAFAEGYEIMAAHELGVDVVATMDAWRQSSVVRSWLLDLLVDGLQRNPTMEGIAPVAKDSGEGRWTVDEAVRLGVPAPVIASSLWSRFSSQRESEAMKVVALLRNQFGGHAIVVESRRPEGEPGMTLGRGRLPLRCVWCCSAPRATWPPASSSRPSTSSRPTATSTYPCSGWRRRSGPTTTSATGPASRSTSTSTRSTSTSSSRCSRR